MLFDKFTCVKHTVGFYASRQEVSGLHGEIRVGFHVISQRACLDAREGTFCSSPPLFHTFLCSPSCVLSAAGIQAAFSALLMGVGGCVLRIKPSAETSIEQAVPFTLACIMPEARSDLLGAFFPFERVIFTPHPVSPSPRKSTVRSF